MWFSDNNVLHYISALSALMLPMTFASYHTQAFHPSRRASMRGVLADIDLSSILTSLPPTSDFAPIHQIQEWRLFPNYIHRCVLVESFPNVQH
jgi:hypothetical protein